MEKTLVLIACSLILSACATTKKDYSSLKQSPETATVVGKVTVLVNGSQDDLQETGLGICELTVTNEGEDTKYKIEKEGSLYLNAKPGVFYFKKLMCFTGIFSDSSYIFYANLPTSVLEKGKINYIGDVVVNWNLGDTKVNWGEFFLSHENPIHRYGLIDVQIASTEKTLSSFLAENPALKKEDSVTSQLKFIDTTQL